MNKLKTHTKLILTDADGVLLRWEQPFREFMTQQGHRFNPAAINSYNLADHYLDIERHELTKLIMQFNNSTIMESLPPLRDATTFVNKLHNDHGYKFRVITSYGTDPVAIARREYNLKSLYGNAIESVVSIEMGASKDKVLEQYTNTDLVWIEDKFENFQIGLDYGLQSILVEHNYNKDKPIQHGYKVTCWKDIYNMLT